MPESTLRGKGWRCLAIGGTWAHHQLAACNSIVLRTTGSEPFEQRLSSQHETHAACHGCGSQCHIVELPQWDVLLIGYS